MSEFDHISWNPAPEVKAAFSLKNPKWNTGSKIPGLNLGYNTSEDDAITTENRTAWIMSAGADPKLTSWGIQVHQNHVQIVEQPGVFPNTDALVTNKPGYSLAIFVADCAAVLLADPQAGVIGAAHAGWKGAVADIVPRTIAEMISLGAKAESLQAFISPCISQAKFEVGDEVAQQFPAQFVDTSREKPHVNLKGFVEHQLKEAGLLDSSIEVAVGCTVSDAHAFYSFRREKDRSGRMMALITLEKI